MAIRKVRFSLVMLLALVLNMGVSHVALAISTSPPMVEAPMVLKGVEQKVKVNIGRLPSEVGDVPIFITAVGEAASYLHFEPSWTLPANLSSKDYIFSIDGTNAPIGTYRVTLTFSKGAPPLPAGESGGASMSVIAGVGVVVEFTVTGDQVVGYTLGDITVSSVESDKHPFAAFSFSNTGNVDWKPDGANITLTNQEDETLKVSASVPAEAFTMVSPGESSRQIIEIPETLLEGSYAISADILYGGAVVGVMKSQPFAVVAPGTLLQSGKLLTATVPKAIFSPNEVIPISLSFLNDGQVPLKGIASAEISRDGVYQDLLVGEELQIVNGTTVQIPLSTHLSEPGSYVIKAFVKFANRKSNSVDIQVTVGGGTTVLTGVNSFGGLGILAGLIVLLVGIFVLYKKHTRKSRSIAPPPSQPIPQPIVAASVPSVVAQVTNTVAPPAQPPAQPPAPPSSRRW